MTDEFRIKVSVRNNLILSAIEAQGYRGHGSISRFCQYAGMTPTELSELTSLRKAPITSEGEFRHSAKLLMEALGAAPHDLWTDQQLTLSLAKNSAESTANAEQIQALLASQRDEAMTLPSPEVACAEGMTRRLVTQVLERVTPRQRKVLAMRFGLEGCSEHTLQEVADVMGVTRERVRQIEHGAMLCFRDRTGEVAGQLRELVND